jgi:iron complex outermembrane receptor protein
MAEPAEPFVETTATPCACASQNAAPCVQVSVLTSPVLKGPASVLFGEGSLAGTVNLVPKRPDFNGRRGEVLMSYGGLETTRLAAGATGPIANGRAAYRADIVWNKTANHIDDAGSNTLSLNGAVDVKLSNAATLGFAVDHFRDDYGSAYFGTPLVPLAVARDPSDLRPP